MTYFRYAILVLILGFALMVALANVGMVTLSLFPDTVAAFVGRNYSISLPLFLVVGAAIGLGLVVGLVWEWLREWSIRRRAARAESELENIRRAERATPVPAVRRQRDEILEIVDGSSSTR